MFNPIGTAITGKLLGIAVAAFLLCNAGWGAYALKLKADVAQAETATAKANTALADLKTKNADERAAFEAKARQAEQDHAKRMSDIDAQRQQEKHDAKVRVDRVVSELRTGERRLREQWAAEVATAQLSAAAAAAAGGHGTSDVRAAAVGRVLRIGAEADTQIRALQEVIRSMQLAQGATATP